MTWVAPKSWPSNSSENGTSSSPMKQAARTAKACSESSIFIASLVVTGSPPIDRAIALIFWSPSILGATLGPFRVRIARPSLHRLLQDAGFVELVFRPVQHHRVGVDRRAVITDSKVADEGTILVIG